jgi:type II secretory pathway component HofQ
MSLMSSFRLIVAASLVVHLPCLHAAGDSPANSYLPIIIPELQFHNTPAVDAINAVSQAAKEQGAEQKGYRGVMIATPNALSEKISLNFKDVPFVYVLKMIAKSLNSDLVIEDGYVLFIGEKSDSMREVPVLLPLNEQTIAFWS